MRILGIDPWTTTIGYAIIEKEHSHYSLLDYGVFHTTPKIDLKDKLLEIWSDLENILEKYSPERAGIEKLFFNTNITTWISVAHARGLIMHEIAKKWIHIYEYTPLQVKKAVTGNGNAPKLQLQKAIQILFWLSDIPKPDDAADAIGIAYITALERKND